VMGEVIDAPWAGRAVRIRRRKPRWICREEVCSVVSFVEQDPAVCVPRGLLSTGAIRRAMDLLRFEGLTIQGLNRQLGTTWNTVWSQVQPLLTAAANDPVYRFRMFRITGGLGASSHTQL